MYVCMHASMDICLLFKILTGAVLILPQERERTATVSVGVVSYKTFSKNILLK
jgi:hypothetical protein